MLREPCPWRRARPAAERTRQRGRVGKAEIQSNLFDRSAGPHQRYRNVELPVQAVRSRCGPRRLLEGSGESAARHARTGCHPLERPVGIRRFVHRDQRLGQSRIGQTHHHSWRDLGFFRVIDDPSKDLDQHDFEQAIGEKSGATADLVCLGKQQIQCRAQAIDLLQRQNDRVGQGLDNGVADASVEIQCRAGEVRPFDRRIDELVMRRTGKEEQRGFGKVFARHRCSLAVKHVHRASPQHMQETAARLCIEDLMPTQRAGMKQRGLYPEALQHRGQAVDRRDTRGGSKTGRIAIYYRH